MMGRYRELSHFILTRGLILCAVLVGGMVLLLLRAGEGGPLAPRLYEYAESFELAALVTFGSALIGSVLMEDLLRYYGE